MTKKVNIHLNNVAKMIRFPLVDGDKRRLTTFRMEERKFGAKAIGRVDIKLNVTRSGFVFWPSIRERAGLGFGLAQFFELVR